MQQASGLILKHIANVARGYGFDSTADQIGQSVADAVTSLRSCVVQALSRGDGPCQSPLASA